MDEELKIQGLVQSDRASSIQGHDSYSIPVWGYSAVLAIFFPGMLGQFRRYLQRNSLLPA